MNNIHEIINDLNPLVVKIKSDWWWDLVPPIVSGFVTAILIWLITKLTEMIKEYKENRSKIRLIHYKLLKLLGNYIRIHRISIGIIPPVEGEQTPECFISNLDLNGLEDSEIIFIQSLHKDEEKIDKFLSKHRKHNDEKNIFLNYFKYLQKKGTSKHQSSYSPDAELYYHHGPPDYDSERRWSKETIHEPTVKNIEVSNEMKDEATDFIFMLNEMAENISKLAKKELKLDVGKDSHLEEYVKSLKENNQEFFEELRKKYENDANRKE